MNRIAGVLVACALVLGVVGVSVPSVRTIAQGRDASPVASPRATPLPQSSLAVGLPAGVSFDELVSGQVDDLPAAPAVLRLERLTFPPDAATGEQEAHGPEILYVEAGEVLVADEFGFESPLAEGDGVLLRPESGYEVTNDGSEDAAVLRLRVLSAADAEEVAEDGDGEPDATPAASGRADAEVQVEVVLDGEIEDPLPEPGVVFLARTTWAPGADTGEYTQAGPVGLLVESGTLTVTSPTGIEGQVREGRGVVLPADVPLRARNADSDDVVALMVGIVPAGGSVVEPVLPTPTPTVQPTETPIPTATVPPTETPLPTNTPQPTDTPEPTATRAPTATSTPMPTPTPDLSLLYEADATGGLDEWTVSGGWQHFQGMLVNDGGGGALTPPYQPSTADYAIEAEIQVVRFDQNNPFGLSARDGGVIAFYNPRFSSASIDVAGATVGGPEGVEVGGDWQTYRLEVEGNVARFLIGGSPVITVTDNRLISMSGGAGVVAENGLQISLRRFAVIALGDESALGMPVAVEQQDEQDGDDGQAIRPIGEGSDEESGASSGIAAMLPDEGEVPAGLVIVEDRQRTLEEIAPNFSDPDDMLRRFTEWGWQGNAIRSFSGQSPPGSTTSVYVSIHRFGSASAAAEALDYSFEDQLFASNAEEVSIATQGDQTRAMVDSSADGNGATLLVRNGSNLIVVTTYYSPQGDPMPDSVAIVGAILAKAEGATLSVGSATDDQADGGSSVSGQLVYSVKVGDHWDLYRHNFANGENRRLTDTPNNDEWAPAWSHDGETIAYLSDVTGSSQVWLTDRFGRDQRQLTDYQGPGSVYYVTWSPDDTQLVVTVAEDFGARVLKMPSEGGSLQEFLPVWSSFPTIATDWTTAYVTWADNDTDVVLADGTGAYLGDVSASAINEDAPNISADGTRVVYNVGDPGGRYVEFLDLTTSEHRPLPQMGDDSNPVWSPDGSAIACVVVMGGVEEVFVVPVEGGEPVRLDIAPHERVWYLAWSA